MSEISYYGGHGGRFLYGNAELQYVCLDEAEGMLTLQILYAEREIQKIIYRGVYSSQIGPSLVGTRISLAEEAPLSLLNDPRYTLAARQLFSSRDRVAPEFLSGLQQQGNKLYLHYISRCSEYLVVAREVQIRPLGP